MKGGLALGLLRLLLIGLVLLAWDIVPRLGLVDPELLPPLRDVLAAIPKMLARPQIQNDLLTTGLEVLVAFALSVPAGVALGLATARSAYLGRVLDPLLFFLFGIPKSIFLPIFILSFGIGFWQKVAFGVFSTVLILVLNAAAAARSVQPAHLLVARSYAATGWQVAARVFLPSMMPVLLEALRLALIFTVTAVILAEMYASRTGIGHQIATWGENYMMTSLLAGVVIIAATCIVVNELIRILERKTGTWRT
jgi:ABC-type nitrate/sulfonate/bicarbonate transport system permease component